MLTEEQCAAAEKARENLARGVHASLPTMGRALREMQKMEREFQQLRAAVRKEIERGARRTRRNPV